MEREKERDQAPLLRTPRMFADLRLSLGWHGVGNLWPAYCPVRDTECNEKQRRVQKLYGGCLVHRVARPARDGGGGLEEKSESVGVGLRNPASILNADTSPRPRENETASATQCRTSRLDPR